MEKNVVIGTIFCNIMPADRSRCSHIDLIGRIKREFSSCHGLTHIYGCRQEYIAAMTYI